MGDTDFANGAGAGGDGFDPMADAFATSKPAERKVQQDAVPRGTYIVEFKGGKGALQGDESIPVARIQATILNGVEGTVGKTIFAPIKRQPNRIVYKKSSEGNKEQAFLNDEDYKKACQVHAGVLARVGQVLGLMNPKPGASEDAMTEYASQFKGKAVIDVSYLPARDDYQASNFFQWDSIASLTERVLNEKGEDQGSAEEVALKAIESANKRALKRAEKKGTKASGFVGGGPGGF